MFWPLIRDLLLESSRTFLRANLSVTSFFATCRRFIGPQTLLGRILYLQELNITDLQGEYSLLQAVWQYSVVLRSCFRKTLHRQLKGFENMEGEIESIVSELKSDLCSSEMIEIIRRLKLNTACHRNLPMDSGYDLRKYTYLIHQFCHLLITLLEAQTLIQGTQSLEGELYAFSILRLINEAWLNSDASLESIFPHSLSRFFVPRILYMAALALRREHRRNGNYALRFPRTHW